MERRALLKLLAGMPIASSGMLMAAPAVTSRLLLVFLRGGYDAASLLVPVTSSFYYESRPNIAIARPGKDQNAALPLDADWGPHPALRDTVYPLFQSGQVAFVPFAGTEDTSRSHFETQDTFELGQGNGSGRNFRSGFLNRLVATVGGVQGMAFTSQLPLVFEGTSAIANTDPRTGKAAITTRQGELIAQMYRETPLGRQVSEGFALREVIQKTFDDMQAANRNAINTKGFEREARHIAHLMKERYQVGFVDVGGWDTHVSQGAATGTLASRFDELGLGLAGFAQEMGDKWKDTVVVVASEFGRTFRENGNRGTDHGHGTVFWVMGGGIHGGRVAGNQQRLEASSLFEARDYPVLNEYRAVLGGLFAKIYGLNQAQLKAIFPYVSPQEIDLI